MGTVIARVLYNSVAGEVWRDNLSETVLLAHIQIQIIAHNSDIFRQAEVFFFIST